ncbi:helix-turn-helix domain-containing protein [Streptomyces sp. WM6378]|uniref:helix-turn-helix domain-containing protein n=1 Tax=Streptomyces sp. WM6378 TaxID=1415557 RepID=UPI0006AEEE33|nr:Scr1 family TA system antitoxin-like transcriptional regulator [Streptomyces sp. WM6378]KOU33314.1 DNA-binding protein [Streptomyces sp. WM6378]
MVRRKDIDGSESVPCFYGKELRWKREAAGLTLQQLVGGSFYGLSYLSEIERGHRRMPHDLAEHVDRKLKTDGFFARNCEDVRKAKRADHGSYFKRILEVEKNAERIEEWCTTWIPGLLQTEPYARAVVRAAHPSEAQAQADAKVYERLARAEIFDTGRLRPEYWVILHESLLRQPILPPSEMAEQFNHIAELTHRHRITPQILPWNSTAQPMLAGAVLSLDFPDAPPLVYTESAYSGETIDDPTPVKQYRRSYDRLRAAALPPEESLAVIENAAESFRNGKHQLWLEGRALTQ